MRNKKSSPYYHRSTDYTGAFFVLIVFIVVAGYIASLVFYRMHIDNINENFTNKCDRRGGESVITDKNLCIKNGLVLFHE